MDLCRFARGCFGWPRLEMVAREFAWRYDRDSPYIRFLETDNWLLTPMIVDDGWFMKVILKQNSLIHAVFITGRNLGAFSSGMEGLFGHFGTPLEMAEHELEATKRLRDIGLQAPVPVEAFEVGDLGVLVFEYLPNLHTLDTAPRAEVERLAPELFATLAVMHDSHLVRDNLRAENVLVCEDSIYFIDATSVNDERMCDARTYDLACGLAAFEPLVGLKKAATAALDSYDVDVPLDVIDSLDFVNIRPDHDFDAASLKGEIEKHTA